MSTLLLVISLAYAAIELPDKLLKLHDKWEWLKAWRSRHKAGPPS